MANEQNLIPGAHTLTVEEQSKGGKESVKTRRLQSALIKALESKADSSEFAEVFEEFGVSEEDRDYSIAIACALVRKAAKGDLSAASFVRDSIGEKPKEELSVSGGPIFISGENDIRE